ncbi:hypothetical protein FisN_12Hu075 [Fistulifera solaris]|uniref:Uncharacterized protein n=1 Tax=Fistulifera solaris TaxID=1519565 RepID=A0A1Z5K2H6_FISSO|nr:hypothetical protein FisN_12Hu075 [Fistulifera solaris]|eukprot:GAX20228.1 hypothetical protein FisN_12Hu075 [Fistulifera solaris]
MSMSLPSKQNKPSLLELIPRSNLQPHQIAVSKGEELPTYKLLRTPETLDEWKSRTPPYGWRTGRWWSLVAFSFHPWPLPSFYDTVPTEQALIRAVRVNQNLKHLEFMAREHQWGRCIQKLFVVAETHKSLRSMKIKSYPDGYDPQYKWLKRLLTRNRYLKVTDILYGEIEADEETFRIYDLNQFFRDSKKLKEAPPAVRPSLVVTALTDEYMNDLQRTGLLLSDNVDVLCKLMHPVVHSSEGIVGEVDMEVENLPAAAALRKRKTT